MGYWYELGPAGHSPALHWRSAGLRLGVKVGLLVCYVLVAFGWLFGFSQVHAQTVSTLAGSETGAPAASVHHVTGSAMGMTWAVKWIGALERSVVEKETKGLLAEIEGQMSTYRNDSEISRFNAFAETNWFPVSTNLARVVEVSLDIARKTDGALDPTVFPLVQVWGFGPERRLGQLPTVKAIAVARARVGYTNLQVRLNPPAVRKLKEEVAMDVSAVAMGFAADRVGERLRQLGSTNHLVDMGGEFVARGEGPEGKGWSVGIEEPGTEGKKIQRVVVLRDECLATSGDDRNFRTINGKRYHHIIDPHTGWPSEAKVASATVIHTSCAQADGWATAMVVVGREKGEALAEGNGFRMILLGR
ncbi:MAG TPA: FAD:protein FMN transferase [Verrucomicrobiae bacterium]